MSPSVEATEQNDSAFYKSVFGEILGQDRGASKTTVFLVFAPKSSPFEILCRG